MKLRLPRNRSLGAGLVWLAADLTNRAAERLAEVAADPIESVHDARMALKRSRSVLRLLEKAGADWAVAPRYRLAMLAGMMSGAREAAVAAALAGRLARGLRGGERTVALEFANRKFRLVPPDAGQIREAIEREAQELVGAPAPAILSGDLRHLLRRSLERVGRRSREAGLRPRNETIHEWRKAVIILRDQTALAAERWPQGAGAARPCLMRLAADLGRRGDLNLLVRRLQRMKVSSGLDNSRRSLIARLERRRDGVTHRALRRWPRLETKLERLLAE